MRNLIILAALALSACNGGTVVKERIVTVDRPVPQPCAGTRPEEPETLATDFPDPEWNAMDVRQKAAAVGRKGLERQEYAERLDAATGACP